MADEALALHYDCADPRDFLAAVLSRMQRAEPRAPYTPSLTAPRGPTLRLTPAPKARGDDVTDSAAASPRPKASWDAVYQVQTLGGIAAAHAPAAAAAAPSPSLGPGSPRVRGTPMGLAHGGALGPAARLVATAPTSGEAGARPSWLADAPDRSHLKTSFARKPLNQRVKDFCQELDDFRVSRSLSSDILT